MKKIKIYFFIASLILIVGCASMRWDYYYPYCKVNPNYIDRNRPNDFEDCLSIIDTVLSKESKEYFKNQDSTIAVLEICNYDRGIAGLFINRWCLDYRRKSTIGANSNVFGFDTCKPFILLEKFEAKGINDPEAIMRVVFSCYYKKINNLKYDWETEIERIKNYWITPKHGEGWVSTQIKLQENRIMSDFRFKKLEIFDTVDILYNKPPRVIKNRPDWYYLTGIIQSKIAETKSINVKLIDIKTEFGEKYMIELKDTLRIGDTITESSNGWLKRGGYYFNYHRNKECRE